MGLGTTTIKYILFFFNFALAVSTRHNINREVGGGGFLFRNSIWVIIIIVLSISRLYVENVSHIFCVQIVLNDKTVRDCMFM